MFRHSIIETNNEIGFQVICSLQSYHNLKFHNVSFEERNFDCSSNRFRFFLCFFNFFVALIFDVYYNNFQT